MELHKEALQAVGLQLLAVGLGEPKHAARYCGKLAPSQTCFAATANDPYYEWGLYQYTAKDMRLENLVKEFGDDLGFFGGVIENELLSFSSPSKIRELVKKNTSILKRKNAFIFAPIHNISQEVPPENVIALYQAGMEFGAF